MSPARQRYDIVTCVVTKHVRYGLLVEIGPGEQGWIDSGDIADSAEQSRPTAWPPPGSTLAAVVLGMDRMGRVRLASRPSYVERIRGGPEGGTGAASGARPGLGGDTGHQDREGS